MNDRINLLHPEIRANPYPLYARMRRDQPVCQVDPGGIWAVTRYRDVQFVLKHPKLFSSAAFQALYKPPWLPKNPVADSLITMDPPAHTKLRTLVSRGFTSRGIARMETRVHAVVNELTERLDKDREGDFVAGFALPLPARIIAEILGLDVSLHQRFKKWSDCLAAISPEPPTDDVAAATRRTVADMESYLSEVVNERCRTPADDLVSDLLRAQVDGDRLNDDEVMAFLFMLLPAGFETTTNLLANIVLGFLARSDDMIMLRNRPAMIPAYIDEVLRHDAPVQGVFRHVTQDVELGGVTIPAGAMVTVLLGSANRDEDEYKDPDRFDPSRQSGGGMAFGHGIHFCIGAALARMEARIAIEALVARFAGVECTSESLTWNRSPTVRGPVALPVRWLI